MPELPAFLELCGPSGVRLSQSRVHISKRVPVQEGEEGDEPVITRVAICDDTLRTGDARKSGSRVKGRARWRDSVDPEAFRAAPCARCIFAPNTPTPLPRAPQFARCRLPARGQTELHAVVPGKVEKTYRLVCRRRVYVDGDTWVAASTPKSERREICRACQRVMKSRWYRDLVRYADAMNATLPTVVRRIEKQRSILAEGKRKT